MFSKGKSSDRAPAVVTAPSYIKGCISYRADPQSADSLGQAYANFTNTMEEFYFEAYGICGEDRQKYMGEEGIVERTKIRTRSKTTRSNIPTTLWTATSYD